MIFRPYTESDADVIVTWLQTEKSMYQWSADRLNEYPLKPETLNEHYRQHPELMKFTACDESGIPIGHIFMRYPNLKDRKTLRFGFIIVDASIRGKGYGKQMLTLAKQYALEFLHVEEITLGVFANNEKAFQCYQSIGFQETGNSYTLHIKEEEWECIELCYHR